MTQRVVNNSGYLGDLRLSIPWNDLKNKPVKIYIDNLLILASPKKDGEYDPQSEEDYAFKVKMDKLAAMEAAGKQSGVSTEQNSTFMSQLATKIVDNLQFSIKNIHIRFEDKSSYKTPFSVGVSIQELSAYSTDENWNEAFISGDLGLIHKFLKLSNLALYWNTDSLSFAGKTPAQFIEALSGTIMTDTGGPISWQYILRPVSGTGKVKICSRPTHGEARYATNLDFEDFALVMDDEQYATFFSLFNSFNLYLKSSKYRKFRPPIDSSPKKDPRTWFQYAAKCVLSDIHEKNFKWSWTYFKQRREDRIKYIELFAKYKKAPLSSDEQVALNNLNRKLTYGDIRLYRFLGEELLKKDKVAASEGQETQPAVSPTSWSSWWYGTGPAKVEETIAVKMDDSQLQQLYETIEFDPGAVYKEETACPEDVLVDVSWKLKTGSISLKKDPHAKKDVLVKMIFDGLSATAIQRPTSWFFVLDLQNLSLQDRSTPGTLYPDIISSKGNVSADPFFAMSLEVNPLDQRADHSLKLKMLPLDIVLNPKMIENVTAFLRPPPSDADSFYVIQAFAQDAISSLAQQTKAGLEFAIERHKTLELKVDVSAPIFILPERFAFQSLFFIL